MLLWIVGILLLVLAGGIGALAYEYSRIEIPEPDAFAVAQASTVYYSDGTTEIGRLSGNDRRIIDCSTLPDYVGNAVVASENRTFWTDSGIDLKGIARALFTNITTGSRQGGSTITQQYAERYYLGETKTYSGKVKEALLALKISQTQDKSTVLCNYMNTIYFGRGAYGIEEAAQRYYGKSAADMTLSEAAMLAGIIPSPSTWDPAQDPDTAQQRFERVISIMAEDGTISQADADAASMPTTIDYTPSVSGDYGGNTGYLLSMVVNELQDADAFSRDDVASGGYSIVTTIDRNKQAAMESVASPSGNGLNEPDGMQTGAMSADPRTGAIVALWGGEDYQTKQLNNATQAQYQPGSTMKAFALIGAAQNGVNMDTTMFNGDSPQTYAGLATPVANYGDKSYGQISLNQATAYSVNTVFMRVTERLGAGTVAQIAQEAGVSSALSSDSPFVTLGIDGVTVQDMTQAYSTIANQGTKVQLHIVASVTDSSGARVYAAAGASSAAGASASGSAGAAGAGTRVFDANVANMVTAAMRCTMEYGTGASAAKEVGHTMAGKSGTANDNTASSFIGYTPSLVTTFAIWYPGADGSAQPLPSWNGHEYAAGLSTRLFTDYMKQALAGTPDEQFTAPTDPGTQGGADGTWGTAGGM